MVMLLLVTYYNITENTGQFNTLKAGWLLCTIKISLSRYDMGEFSH